MYRRFLIASMAAVGICLPAALPTAAADEEGFRPIFDGQALDGWDGDPRFWRVEDGMIIGESTPDMRPPANTYLIWRQGEVDDFELKLEYRLHNHNSGIQYRSWEHPERPWGMGGYQADIVDGPQFHGVFYEELGRGVIAQRGLRMVIDEDGERTADQFADGDELYEKIHPEGEWNEYHIIARGHRFVQKINGHTMVEVTDREREHFRRSGLIGVQLHAGQPMRIDVRNVRLKRLPLEEEKKVVFVAGTPSHGYGNHEHNAGCLLLAELLNEHVPGVRAVVYQNGWPDDPTALDNADTLVVFANGGGGHPMIPHLEAVQERVDEGMGVVMLHFAVEVPKERGGQQLLDWIGGYFETHWSVNPFWTAEFTDFPDHPVANGLRPFSVYDEWYYHMRFQEDMEGVEPILTAVPPDSTRERPDGPHSNNPHVRARRGMPEHVAWTYERDGGGRGFGFTGGHYHWTWAQDDFRKAVLNGIVWTAGLDIPEKGIVTPTPTMEELEANQDYEQPDNFNRREWVERLQAWAAERE